MAGRAEGEAVTGRAEGEGLSFLLLGSEVTGSGTNSGACDGLRVKSTFEGNWDEAMSTPNTCTTGSWNSNMYDDISINLFLT